MAAPIHLIRVRSPRPVRRALHARRHRYYALLSVPKDADEDTLKKAYRKASLKHHPDKGGDPAAFNRMKRAYDVLNDPAARKRYDLVGLDLSEGDAAVGEDGGEGSAGDPADEVYAAGKPVFAEIANLGLRTLAGCAIVLLARFRVVRWLLFVANLALFGYAAKGEGGGFTFSGPTFTLRCKAGGACVAVNAWLAAAARWGVVAFALEATMWFCALGFAGAVLAAALPGLIGEPAEPEATQMPSKRVLAAEAAVCAVLAYWTSGARLWRYAAALALEILLFVLAHLFFSMAGALAKEIVEQKLGKYAARVRAIVADSDKRRVKADAERDAAEARLAKLQKAMKQR